MNPSSIEIVEFLLEVIDFHHEFVRDNHREPSFLDYNEYTEEDTELTKQSLVLSDFGFWQGWIL